MKGKTLKQRIHAHRWNWRCRRWWRPLVQHGRLATGSFEGWHMVWGPFHVWNVVTRNGGCERGIGWR